MKVRIKKLHPDAVIPTYAKHGDAGMDLTAISQELHKEFLYKEYKTGLSIEIPEGYVGLIFPRSSISNKSVALANAVGVIDSGYRGEITIRFKTDGNVSGKFIKDAPFLERDFSNYTINHYKVGDKVAQLVILPYPHIEFEETDDLTKTERGSDGYGSSDEKEFEIWSEGFRATGESGTAFFHGKSKGKDFKEAVQTFAKDNRSFVKYFSPDTFTYWGCRIFDNEVDARKSFG